MKRVLAHDKNTGALVGPIHAASVTDASRYAYKYGCPYDGCNCTFHWRRAVNAKGNTDPIPPTFAKNPGSDHKAGCPADFEAIHRENIDYTTVKDGRFHVRVNFPLGSARVDRFPKRGFLTEEIMRAVQDQREIKPFGSMKALADFLEKNFESLESDAASEVMVNYQGRAAEWGKLFRGSDRYDKLYVRSLDFRHQDEGKDTPPIITVVRPMREAGVSGKGHRKFTCEEQRVKIDRRWQRVIPVIVCDNTNPDLLQTVQDHIAQNNTILISARPFHPPSGGRNAQFGQKSVSLFIHSLDQITQVSADYWHPSIKRSPQLDLFNGPEPIAAFR